MVKTLKYLLFAIVLGTLFLPLAEEYFDFLPDRSLKGSFETVEEPFINIEDWKSGTFQSNFEEYLNNNLGGRDLLVRLRNQYYYSVFNIAMANGVSPAKDGILLEEEYVSAFYGTDFAGEEFLEDKLKRWKRVEKGLDSIGVKAFLALAPGKGSYYEEQLSEFLKDEHQPTTNYKFISNWAKNNQLRLLDIKSLYHAWIDTSRYPLFPKCGIHWSEYGVAHVVDTLRGYIQNVTQKPLQDFRFDVRVAEKPEGTDNDIGEGMNLYFTPSEKGLAYPIRYFGADTTIAPTRFLAIGDSYYFNIFYSGFADRVCSHGGFWYYYRSAYPGEKYGIENLESIDVLNELKQTDVLMLMMTEPQLKRFGWGAVEKLETLLYPELEISETAH